MKIEYKLWWSNYMIYEWDVLVFFLFFDSIKNEFSSGSHLLDVVVVVHAQGHIHDCDCIWWNWIEHRNIMMIIIDERFYWIKRR